eukprot:gene14735-17411_t
MVRMHLEFVYAGYKEDFWWWECVQLARKFVVSFVLVYYRSEYYKQLVLAQISTDTVMLAVSTQAPFLAPIHNNFEGYHLFTTAITLQCSLLFYSDGSTERVSETGQLLATITVVLMNCGVLVFFLVAFSSRVKEQYGQQVENLLEHSQALQQVRDRFNSVFQRRSSSSSTAASISFWLNLPLKLRTKSNEARANVLSQSADKLQDLDRRDSVATSIMWDSDSIAPSEDSVPDAAQAFETLNPLFARGRRRQNTCQSVAEFRSLPAPVPCVAVASE